MFQAEYFFKILKNSRTIPKRKQQKKPLMGSTCSGDLFAGTDRLQEAGELTTELTTELNKKAPIPGLIKIAFEPERWWSIQDLNL